MQNVDRKAFHHESGKNHRLGNTCGQPSLPLLQCHQALSSQFTTKQLIT